MLDTTGERQAAPFIALQGVEVVYSNDTVALQALDLDLAGQEITVLLDPSGAGKSTLLRVLNRLVAPSEGVIHTHDLGALSDRKTVRRHRLRTGMVFQQHQLIPQMTALQNVLLSRVANYSFLRSLLPLPDHERKWALECLDRVDLFEKALVRCDSLSGGQQQRVGIARALAQRPDLVLADEPVASLDPASSERVLGLLRSICREDGIPVVISLHQVEYARQYGDRILGLSQGKVVFDGPPSALDDGALQKIYGSAH